MNSTFEKSLTGSNLEFIVANKIVATLKVEVMQEIFQDRFQAHVDVPNSVFLILHGHLFEWCMIGFESKNRPPSK